MKRSHKLKERYDLMFEDEKDPADAVATESTPEAAPAEEKAE